MARAGKGICPALGALDQVMVSQVGRSDSCQAWNGRFLILKIFSAILRRCD